jgi:predicted amidohydrolase
MLKTMAGGGVRVVIAPEYFFSDRGMVGKNKNIEGPLAMGRDDKHDLYNGLKKISSKAGDLVIVGGSIFYKKTVGGNVEGYNVCPVLQNGGFLTKQYKDNDDSNLRYGDPGATYEHKTAAPYFKVGGVRLGVEICADHTWHKLKDWANNAGKTIDIHIIISEGSAVQPQYVVAQSYVIHCDQSGTTGGLAKVYQANAQLTEVRAAGVSKPGVNGVTVYIYKLTV